RGRDAGAVRRPAGQDAVTPGRRWPKAVLPAVAVVAAAWSLVPLAVWWDGADPEYFAGAWRIWGWGSAVTALAALLLMVVTGGRVVSVLLALWRRLARTPPAAFALTMAVALAALTVACTVLVFAGNPRNVDG